VPRLLLERASSGFCPFKKHLNTINRYGLFLQIILNGNKRRASEIIANLILIEV
jgi:hypothetical protein